MKRIFFAFSLCLIASFCFSKEVVISSEPCEIKTSYAASQLEKRKSFIVYDEMMKDIDLLSYYLKTAYAGYDVLLKNGYDENEMKKHFENLYKAKSEIDTYSLMNELSDYFSHFPEDLHFSINGTYGKEWITPFQKSFFYYSNVFVEETETGFVVSESDVPSLKKGMKYNGSSENLFYYPSKNSSKNEKSYRIGTVSPERKADIEIQFDDETVKIPLYVDTQIESFTLLKYHEIETEKSGYVSISSFVLPYSDSMYRKGAEIVFEKFVNVGNKWKGKENIIVDLRSNRGGRSFYGTAFVYSMLQNKPISLSDKTEKKIDNWNDAFFSDYEYIESPSVIQAHIMHYENTGETKTYYYKNAVSKWKKQQKNPQKIWSKVQLSSDLKELKSDFCGKFIILTDRNSASASEEFVYKMKKVFGNEKVKAIGENTAGCYEYWDVLNYLLPNSKLSVQLGSRRDKAMQTLQQWHGEGYGIYPDYWAIGSDLNETIFLVTSDEEMKEKLKNIEFRLQ